jgi:hypothetical protein
MRSFAAAHGHKAVAVRVAPPEPRTLEAMAKENAAEGCVRETFGALVASWQARAASNRHFAASMSAVAADETRHAELSWAVDAFCQTRLDAAAAKRVRQARRDAVDELAVEIAQSPPAILVEYVGLPDRAQAQRFFDAAKQTLWCSSPLT